MVIPQSWPGGSGDRAQDAPALASARLLGAVLLGLVAAKLAVFLALALDAAFVMDEFWVAAHGRFRLADLYRELWPAKPVLYAAVFRLAYLGAETSAAVMTAARLLAAGAALLGLGVLYAIARNLGYRSLEGFFALAVVLSFASYLEWAFLVRPEPLALTLALMALWLAMRPAAGPWAILGAGLMSGLAFLTLQKAAYFNLALGLALVGDGLARRALGAALRDGALLVLGWAAALAAYVLVFGLQGVEPGVLLRHLFLGPAVENALGGHAAYEGGLRSFVVQTLARDPLLYLLCAAGLALRLPALARCGAPERRAWIFTLVTTALVFAHRSPWPYNFILAIPVLALWAPAVARAAAHAGSAWKAAFSGLLLAAVVLSFARNWHVLGHDNAFQLETVRRAEALLSPSDTYFDGIGMLVTRQQAGTGRPGAVISWDQAAINRIRASAAGGASAHLGSIFADAPKLWILSYRTLALEALLGPYLERGYAAIFPNLLIAGRELPPGATTGFDNRWPGAYRLYDRSGRPSERGFELDGRPVSGRVELSRGGHRLRVPDAAETYYLLPAEIAIPLDLGAPRAQRPLFLDTYTY